MLAINQPIWKSLLLKRRTKRIEKLLQKRALIQQKGIRIFADVIDCHDSDLIVDDYRLVRVRLQIVLLDNKCIYPFSYTLASIGSSKLKGMRVQVQFLPGDLSHVVLR